MTDKESVDKASALAEAFGAETHNLCSGDPHNIACALHRLLWTAEDNNIQRMEVIKRVIVGLCIENAAALKQDQKNNVCALRRVAEVIHENVLEAIESIEKHDSEGAAVQELIDIIARGIVDER